MSATFETAAKEKVDVHHMNTGVPYIIEESIEGYYIEHGDLSLEELLQDQEIVYQSFQTNTMGDIAKASASSDSSPIDDDGGDNGGIVEEGESSQVNNVESQLAADEAYARSLQELENQLAGSHVDETTEAVMPSSSSTASSTANRELNSVDTATVVRRQDDIDPENMSYEELRSLGEEIGSEGRGLSEEVISYLEPFKYKRLSRKDKHEECVICRREYKNRDMLIALPCHHHYHSHCITRWLKLNKACPVCNVEVFGS